MYFLLDGVSAWFNIRGKSRSQDQGGKYSAFGEMSEADGIKYRDCILESWSICFNKVER